MRQRVEFRTPQHPSLGTNNWGGASPLLARNIPKESLESKYARLNSARTSHEIFLTDNHHLNHSFQDKASKHEHAATATRGILYSLLFQRKEKTTIVLGSKSKRRIWFPRLDPQNRWPNGWC